MLSSDHSCHSEAGNDCQVEVGQWCHLYSHEELCIYSLGELSHVKYWQKLRKEKTIIDSE